MSRAARQSPKRGRAGQLQGGLKRRTGKGRSTAVPQYKIAIADRQTCLTVSAAALRRIALCVLQAEGVATAAISIALVDNATIRALNRQYLNHDYKTDVLSFLFESEWGEPNREPTSMRGRQNGPRHIDGEVIVSAEMALDTAGRFGWGPKDELALYLVHGVLHLCGYDDRTDRQRRTMRGRERAMLTLLGVAPGERVSTKRGPA